VGPLESEAEVIVEVEHTGGSRGMELLIVGAVGALDVGVVLPAALADAFELHVGVVEDTFVESL